MTDQTWTANSPGNSPQSGFQATAEGLDEFSTNNAPARVGFTVPTMVIPEVRDAQGNIITPAQVRPGYAVMTSISGDSEFRGATIRDPNGNVLFQGDAKIRASDILDSAAVLTSQTQETVRALSADQLAAFKAEKEAFVESLRVINPTLADLISRLLTP